MRRRDFTIGVLLAGAVRAAQAQEPAMQHRIAIVIPAGPVVARIHDPASRYWQAFWEELRRLGDAEGQNLVVEGCSGEGRPAGYPDLAREVTGRNPDVIVAVTGGIAQAVRAATTTIPIVWIGVDPIASGLVTSLAHPGENITGVSLFDLETYAKRLQILKDTIPTASKVAFLAPRRAWESGQALQQALQDVGRRLDMSVIPMLIEESAPSEYRRVFAQIALERADGLIVPDVGDLVPYRQLIVELAEKSRLPAIFGTREYVEAGGLMAYGADEAELFRRMADDVHEILNGTKPGDIPIYQAARFQFIINLRAAEGIGLTIPAALLARADEVIE
jgi:putative ABC transport system substrate-binding protein